ncbi:hypothetical protein KC973_03640 [Candidatus Saccharibacteria bacterium]|nr:hypothetical protein [Candidatus Saccharibacteria bacterium]
MKAIIPVAGWGTRRLPITKSIEKCMLPIGNRPIVDYVVEDCIKAGINDIIFVVGEQSTQIQNYYGRNIMLEDYLISVEKPNLLDEILPPRNVTFHYVTQPQNGKYGTAIPVALAAEAYDCSPGAVVLMGDDFIYHPDSSSEVARLIKCAGSDSALLGVKVPDSETSKYGVLQIDSEGRFEQIVEKPVAGEAPSNLINVSKYVMNPTLLSEVVAYSHENHEGEYYITEPINRYTQAGGVLNVLEAAGQYLDGGTLEGWLEANQTVLSME